MHTKSLPYVFLLSLFWGTNVVASRFGIGEFNPYLFITLRLTIAVLCFVPVLLLIQGKLPTRVSLWKKAALSGLLGVAIPMPTFILSLQYQSSGVASLYVTTFPVMLIIAAHYILPDERMTRNKALGVTIALCGALFLAIKGESGLSDIGRANPLGFILIIVGLMSEVCNTMFVRLHMKDEDPLQVTGIRLFTGAIIVAIVTSFFGDFSFANVTRAGYFSLAYAAIFGALAAQFLAFFIQGKFGATAFSMTSFIVPVVATLFGALLLGEILTWAMAVGMLLIGTGLYLVNK